MRAVDRLTESVQGWEPPRWWQWAAAHWHWTFWRRAIPGLHQIPATEPDPLPAREVRWRALIASAEIVGGLTVAVVWPVIVWRVIVANPGARLGAGALLPFLTGGYLVWQGLAHHLPALLASRSGERQWAIGVARPSFYERRWRSEQQTRQTVELRHPGTGDVVGRITVSPWAARGFRSPRVVAVHGRLSPRSHVVLAGDFATVWVARTQRPRKDER